MSEPQTYVARKPCGCLTAAVVNVPNMLDEVGKMMRTAARHEGERVELMDTERVRTMPWKCEQHRVKAAPAQQASFLC